MSSDRGEWETPDALFSRVARLIRFNLDVAASAENALCRRFYTVEDDALTQSWKCRGGWWCNPPYGRDVIRWVQKARAEQRDGNPGVMLLPARTDTRWFQDHLYRKRGVEIEYIRGRLQFTLDGKPITDKKGRPTSAPFPSMLVYLLPL